MAFVGCLKETVARSYNNEGYLQDYSGKVWKVKDWLKVASDYGELIEYVGDTPEEVANNISDFVGICNQLAKKYDGEKEGLVSWFGDYALYEPASYGKTKYGDIGEMSKEEKRKLIINVYLKKAGILKEDE